MEDTDEEEEDREGVAQNSRSSGASVLVEFGCTLFFAYGCTHQPELAEPPLP